MATNAWDETAPAGTQLASTIDDHMRQMKLDLRERLETFMKIGVSTSEDGYIKTLPFRAADDTSLISTNVANSLTGSGAANMVDLAQTWNTTGAPTAIKVNITDTASAAGSNLLDLQVGGVSKFKISKAGVPTIAGGIPESALSNDGLLARVADAEAISGVWSFAELVATIFRLGTGSTAGGPLNNVSETAFATSAPFRLYQATHTGTYNIHGIAAGSGGQLFIVVWTAPGVYPTLRHESASASASARLNLGGSDLTLSATQPAAVFVYSTANNRWNLINR
jgi:hypothetical protein